MVQKDRKATLQAFHTDAVKAAKSRERKVVLDGRPPAISNSDLDIVDSWVHTRAESKRMKASMPVQTVAQLHPHTHHIVTPGFVDRPRWSDGAAGQMEG